MDGDALSVRARSIALDTGRVQVDVTERGPLHELFAIVDRIGPRIAPARRPVSADAGHPPIGVFEDFIKGLLAETPATAVKYLTAALKAQPTFDRARLALWDVYDESTTDFMRTFYGHLRAGASKAGARGSSPRSAPATASTGS